MAGPTPHCAPGKSWVTAAAIRWAVLCRCSSRASGLLDVTILTRASRWRGNVRSTRRSSTIAASAALARPGEMSAATSAGVEPADTRRLSPSGSVTEISFINRWEGAQPLRGLPTRLRASRYGGQAGLGLPTEARTRAGSSERRLVGTGRLELPTSCVSSRRSNQLSYAPMSPKTGLTENDSLAESGGNRQERRGQDEVG